MLYVLNSKILPKEKGNVHHSIPTKTWGMSAKFKSNQIKNMYPANIRLVEDVLKTS